MSLRSARSPCNGSAADQTPFAQKYASLGYAVLSYSGLGFGGSGCKSTLDDPDFDGQAGSQLVSFLGGAGGIGFTDAAHTAAAAPVDFIVRDKVDHDGKKRPDDPRVGVWGGSYGGQIQFAVAGVDASGKASLINSLVAPVRVPDVTKPLHVTLPAFAHRFAQGHRIAVYLAGGDANYRAGTVSAPVSVVTGSTAQRLTLPVVN